MSNFQLGLLRCGRSGCVDTCETLHLNSADLLSDTESNIEFNFTFGDVDSKCVLNITEIIELPEIGAINTMLRDPCLYDQFKAFAITTSIVRESPLTVIKTKLVISNEVSSIYASLVNSLIRLTAIQIKHNESYIIQSSKDDVNSNGRIPAHECESANFWCSSKHFSVCTLQRLSLRTILGRRFKRFIEMLGTSIPGVQDLSFMLVKKNCSNITKSYEVLHFDTSRVFVRADCPIDLGLKFMSLGVHMIEHKLSNLKVKLGRILQLQMASAKPTTACQESQLFDDVLRGMLWDLQCEVVKTRKCLDGILPAEIRETEAIISRSEFVQCLVPNLLAWCRCSISRLGIQLREIDGFEKIESFKTPMAQFNEYSMQFISCIVLHLRNLILRLDTGHKNGGLTWDYLVKCGLVITCKLPVSFLADLEFAVSQNLQVPEIIQIHGGYRILIPRSPSNDSNNCGESSLIENNSKSLLTIRLHFAVYKTRAN